MAAKRKAKSSQKAAGKRAVDVGRAGLGTTPQTPGELPAPADGRVGGDREARPVVPKAGPVPRGSARFAGSGRGQGAPQARRYAFRRS